MLKTRLIAMVCTILTTLGVWTFAQVPQPQLCEVLGISSGTENFGWHDVTIQPSLTWSGGSFNGTYTILYGCARSDGVNSVCRPCWNAVLYYKVNNQTWMPTYSVPFNVAGPSGPCGPAGNSHDFVFNINGLGPGQYKLVVYTGNLNQDGSCTQLNADHYIFTINSYL